MYLLSNFTPNPQYHKIDMRTVLALFVSALVIGEAAGQTKQTRNVGDFNSLEVGGAFTVYLRMGDEASITLVGKKEDLDEVETNVVGGTLKVSIDSDWWGSAQNDKIELFVTFKQLREIDLSGACNVIAKNTLRSNALSISASGASKLNMAVACTILDVDVSGATNATFSGTCTKVNIESSGASAIYAADLQTESMNLDVSGASKAEVFVLKQLSIDASGASKVRYKGNPSITQDVSGASSVQKL
jgi:hypothetical protein